ncbi:MAG: type II toxin-antitoxin system MqsA family antitoxin [Candidatus Edwardsbacteria bacterium]|nr:type II toxin-antitoxin system MqsA family antitoxin [Candidatus Edwardsbacteria bacterium]
MKLCNFCGNINFREQRMQYIYRHGNQLLMVNNVPCEVCEYCGEQYFAADTLKRIEKDFNDIYLSGKKPQSEIMVPIEEFAGL